MINSHKWTSNFLSGNNLNIDKFKQAIHFQEYNKENEQYISQAKEFQRGINVESTFGALHAGAMLRNIAIVADPDQNTHNSPYIPENHLQTNSPELENRKTDIVINHAAVALQNNPNIDDDDFDCAPQARACKKQKVASAPRPTVTAENPQIILDSSFEFKVGQAFRCTLKEMVQFAKAWAKPQHISMVYGDGTDLRNKPKANKLVLVCQRSRLTKKKQCQEADESVSGASIETTTGTKDSKKRRASSSFKCGCDFKLKFKYHCDGNVCIVKQACLSHINGCALSLLQYEILQCASFKRKLQMPSITRYNC